MTDVELRRLLDFVAGGDDEQSTLTRKLLGDHLVVLAQAGDVDVDGEIIDCALLRRLRRAIGELAGDLDLRDQTTLALAFHLEGRCA